MNTYCKSFLEIKWSLAVRLVLGSEMDPCGKILSWGGGGGGGGGVVRGYTGKVGARKKFGFKIKIWVNEKNLFEK